MRQLVYAALMADTVLQSMISQRLYASGALGVDDIPADPDVPYVQLAWGEASQYREVRKTTTTARHALRAYVYDGRGSFTVIDNIHRQMRHTIEGLGGTVSPSGRRCTDTEFITLGGEDVVAGRNLNVRMALYRITGPL
jgi:hypothetical protein